MGLARSTVAIVGGGFTGAAVAYHLARAGVRAELVVFEPRPRLGAGLAYGGADPVHRINVPATRMSLLPDDEAQFARWLEASGTLAGDPAALSGADVYARRQDFGRYVDEQVRPFVEGGRIRHVRDAVVGIAREGDRWRVTSRGGESVLAEFVVLATTHPQPTIPAELLSLRGDTRLVPDGLSDRALDSVGADDRVLIVGTGLTAADLVASLDARGHQGAITMISRRGLRSRGHPAATLPAEGDFSASPARTATALLRRIRRAVAEAEAGGRSWHPVLDAARGQGGAIWAGLEPEARRRVARHLRPFWDVHRFRIAPQIDALIERKLTDGSLEIRKARLGAVTTDEREIFVGLREARRGVAAPRAFERVIVATGPSHGAIFAAQPALAELAALGLVALDPTGLGLSTSAEGRAIGATGIAEPSLFVAGPLARGTFGELMGLPQVSRYALFIAERVGEALADGRASTRRSA